MNLQDAACDLLQEELTRVAGRRAFDSYMIVVRLSDGSTIALIVGLHSVTAWHGSRRIADCGYDDPRFPEAWLAEVDAHLAETGLFWGAPWK